MLSQVVEAELGVRPVRDVAAVRGVTRVERHEVLDRAHGGAKRLVDRARPLRVALGEVVVDRHEVDVLPAERVEVERLHRCERLALARLLLRDVALVEDDAGLSWTSKRRMPIVRLNARASPRTRRRGSPRASRRSRCAG